VKKAYYDLWQVQQNLRLYSRERELMTQFVAIAEKKYAVGRASQSDVLRAQVELTRLATKVTTETLKVDEAKALLNRLLSRSPNSPVGIPYDPPSPTLSQTFAELAVLTLHNQPDITIRQGKIARDTATLALAEKALLPDFEVYLERFVNSGRRDGFWIVVSTTIPLAFREKYDAVVAEARALLNASQAELRAAQNRAVAEVQQALARTQAAAALVTLLTHTHILQAEQALASSRIGYQSGTIDFLSLLDSLRVIEQVHREHIAATADFEKAHADLKRAVGQPLSRR
jgi:cobalt-zinc-cadmium efflux system outer membrane protein